MKKRALAILLTVLLVVSAALILTACKKEYTVTFREANSKKLEEVTTVKGIATPSEKTTKKAGYTLEGWYKTVDADEEGRYIFTDKVDLSKEIFKEDTDLYANWTRNISKGEDEGYSLIGIIGGVTNWDPEEMAANEDVQFTHAEDPINLYTITLDLKGLDEIKVKTSYKDWDTKEINYGGEKVTNITKGAEATLPTGVENVEDLFTLSGNIGIMCDMNVTIKFYYAGKLDSYIEIVVNSTTGDVVKPVADVGFIMVGTITGWAEKIEAANTELAKYILATEDKNIFTATGIELPAGEEFKLKVNEGGWGRGEYGAGKLNEVTFAAGVTTLPEGITAENAKEVFTGDFENEKGNIGAQYTMTINLTFDLGEGTFDIEITAIDPTKPKTDAELGYLVVCTANNFYDKGTVDPTDAEKGKFVMTVDKTTETLFTATGLEFSKGHTFRVKLNIGGWKKEYNYTNAEFKFAAGVEFPAGITSFDEIFSDAGDGPFDGHNIVVSRVNFTADFALDTSKEENQLTITITKIEIARTDDEMGYIVVGDATCWEPGIAEGSANAAYIMTPDATNTHLFTYTTPMTVAKGQGFRVKVNNGAWSGNIGFDQANFVFATGVEHEGIENAIDLFKDAGGTDHNINVQCKSVTVTLSLNTGVAAGEKKLTVTVTAFTPAETEPELSDQERGFVLTGKINGNPDKVTNWAKNDQNYLMSANDQKTVFTLTGVQFAANDEFNVKVNIDDWTGQWGYKNDGTGVTVTLDASITGNPTEYVPAKGTNNNIVIAKACTATIVFNYDAETPANSTIAITITAVESSTTTPETPAEPAE